MTRPKQTSAAEIEIQEILTTDEQLLASCRKLARLRSNLKALQVEISDKILNGVQDCQKTCAVALSSVGEVNAAFTNQNK
jgi:hypothetical protein